MSPGPTQTTPMMTVSPGPTQTAPMMTVYPPATATTTHNNSVQHSQINGGVRPQQEATTSTVTAKSYHHQSEKCRSFSGGVDLNLAQLLHTQEATASTVAAKSYHYQSDRVSPGDIAGQPYSYSSVNNIESLLRQFQQHAPGSQHQVQTSTKSRTSTTAAAEMDAANTLTLLLTRSDSRSSADVRCTCFYPSFVKELMVVALGFSERERERRER